MNMCCWKSSNQMYRLLRSLSAGRGLVLLLVVLAIPGCFREPTEVPPATPCADVVLLEGLSTDGAIIPGEDVTLEWQFTHSDEFAPSVEVDEIVNVVLSPAVPCETQALVRENEVLASSITQVNRSAQLSEMVSCIDQVQGATEMTVTVEYQNAGCALPNSSITEEFTFRCGACAGATATRSELVANSVQLAPLQGTPTLTGTVGFEVDFCEVAETEPEIVNVAATLSILRSNNPICTSEQTIDQIAANGEAEVSITIDAMVCDMAPEPDDVLQLAVLAPTDNAECGAGNLDANNVVQSTQ